MKPSICLPLKSPGLTARTVGGKAAALASLLAADVPVPAGFVIPAGTSLTQVKEHQEDILSSFDVLATPYVAVRSSAVAEDGANASWAGQLETVLGVTRPSLIDAIQKCLDSVNTSHATTYAELHQSAGQVAVLVQQLVQARTAGVMFTANPVTGNTDQIIIEAVAGLGETLVQGLSTPESWTLAKLSGKVLNQSEPSQPTLLALSSTGTQEVANTQSSPYLSTGELSQLVAIAAQLEQHFGKPQDIEWAIEGDEIYILQSRPITTL